MATSILHSLEELQCIGEKILRARESKGFSQKDFAQRVKVPASVLSNIEKGKRLVPRLKIAKFAEVLGLKSDELRPITSVSVEELRDDLKALQQEMGIGFRSLQTLPDEAKKELIEKFKELKARYEKSDGAFASQETPAEVAHKVLSKCQIKSLPIDLKKIGNEYSMEIGPSSTIDADGWILFSKDQKWASIKYREGMPPGRNRFTIAHEMGHFFLQNMTRDEQSCQIEGGKKSQLERDADEFASHLLMPERQMKPLVGSRIAGYEDILKVSNACEVSQQSAAIRLMQVTTSAAAVICSEAGRIKWGWPSAAMHLRVKKDHPLARFSQANKSLVQGTRGLVKPVASKCDYWFYGQMRGKFMEHTSRLYEDKLLSLIWKV
jgi:transcriptional regulator with XRE-family HTH domain